MIQLPVSWWNHIDDTAFWFWSQNAVLSRGLSCDLILNLPLLILAQNLEIPCTSGWRYRYLNYHRCVRLSKRVSSPSDDLTIHKMDRVSDAPWPDVLLLWTHWQSHWFRSHFSVFHSSQWMCCALLSLRMVLMMLHCCSATSKVSHVCPCLEDSTTIWWVRDRFSWKWLDQFDET